jgi:hypothetical protein
MYYSDLGGFKVETDASPVCVDYFTCTDQSNWRLREKAATAKNQGNFLLFPDDGGKGVFFYKEVHPTNQQHQTVPSKRGTRLYFAI